jgi:hypothetical protein
MNVLLERVVQRLSVSQQVLNSNEEDARTEGAGGKKEPASADERLTRNEVM